MIVFASSYGGPLCNREQPLFLNLFDQENRFTHQDHDDDDDDVARAIRTGDIDETKIMGRPFKIWLPAVVKSNFFSFNVRDITCRTRKPS